MTTTPVDSSNDQQKQLLQPPLTYKHYLNTALFMAVLFMVLDSIYRFELILSYLSLPAKLINGAWLYLFFALAAGLFAGAVFFIQKGWDTLFNKRQPSNGVASFLYFLVFVYFNILYLKYHLVTLRNTFDVVVEQDSRVMFFLFLGLMIVYAVFQKRIQPGAVQEIVTAFSKPVYGLVIISIVICVTSLVINGWHSSTENNGKQNEPGDKPPVILVSLDSLGTMHSSLYGYPRKTTPRLEEFARESYVFNHMHANSDSTEYALPCVLGHYPRISAPGGKPPVNLLQVLQQAGYRQRVFISFRNLQGNPVGFTRQHILFSFDATPLGRWLGRGNNDENLRWLSSYLSQDERFFWLMAQKDPRDFGGGLRQPFPTALYLDKAMETLKNSPSGTFVWVHMWEPHNPYIIPQPYLTHFGTSLVDRYDGAILYADSLFGNFIDKLRKEGLYDRALIIAFGDHGEAHGEENHAGLVTVFHISDWLNNSVVKVPLLVHLPGQKERIDPQTFAEHVDLAPTILSIIGLPVPGSLEGESLVPYMQNPGLLSQKIKISVPFAVFARRTYYLDKKPAHWVFGNAEIINAFWYRYKIGWVQTYLPNPGNHRRIDRQEKVIYYGVYDLFQSGKTGKNYPQDPGFTSMLQDLFNSSLTRLYRDASVKEWTRLEEDNLTSIQHR